MRRQRVALVLVLIAICVVGVSAQQQSVPISGKVIDPNGEPIQHASVEFDSDGNTTRTVTDPAGDFTVLSPRSYGTLLISSPGFSTVKIKVVAEKNSLRIQLYPAVINERVVVSAPITQEERVPPTSSSQFNVGPHEIDAAGALTIDDVLRQVPGFSLFRRSGGLTTNPTAQGVSLRGVGASGASRALVLLDGVPLNSPFGGWVYWNRVPRVNIENVSVQNGASSSVYGSGALGGVVNITSDTRSGTGLDVLASAGNKGTAVTSFSAGKILGDWGSSPQEKRYTQTDTCSYPRTREARSILLRERAISVAQSRFQTSLMGSRSCVSARSVRVGKMARLFRSTTRASRRSISDSTQRFRKSVRFRFGCTARVRRLIKTFPQ